jgi:hypothetical protein
MTASLSGQDIDDVRTTAYIYIYINGILFSLSLDGGHLALWFSYLHTPNKRLI